MTEARKLKAPSRLALLKIAGDQATCTQCGTCNRVCPMNINIMEYINNGERVLSTECIWCMTGKVFHLSGMPPGKILSAVSFEYLLSISGSKALKLLDIGTIQPPENMMAVFVSWQVRLNQIFPL